MPKKQSERQVSAEVAQLRDRLILTVRFIEKRQEFPSAPHLRAIVDAAAAKGDLRALRLIVKEVDAMALSLDPAERERLELLLESQLGVNRDVERARLRAKVTDALQRGTISSEKERRRLEEYADMLEITNGDPAEIAAVRRLVRMA